MFGHFTELPAAGAVPVAPEGAGVPEVPEDDELVVGVVDEFVAAWAATPPPRTRTPETAKAAAVLWIARMLLTSLRGRIRCGLTRASQTVGPGRPMGDAQEAMKKAYFSGGCRSVAYVGVCAVNPPSTRSTSPVTNAASSDARNATERAISSGYPSRPTR
jgi:hypothetical protein